MLISSYMDKQILTGPQKTSSNLMVPKFFYLYHCVRYVWSEEQKYEQSKHKLLLFKSFQKFI